ncbi:MAG: toprim domain-containing protein [Ignavibacteriales bacterium]|nr:toprim domain-containing protein [Ignavibacteriales bacterium]
MYNNSKVPQSNKTIDELKSKINAIPAEQIAGKLKLNLTKTGYSLQGNCPSGHTSTNGRCFSINTKNNYWHCFNCNAGGDYIELIKAAKKIDFIPALEWLATEFNLGPVPKGKDFTPPSPEEIIQRERDRAYSELYEEVYTYLHEKLFELEGRHALEYLINERKYDKDILKETEFCGWTSVPNIRDHLKIIFPDAYNLINSLSLNGHNGDIYDIAIPYRDRKGMITGFIKRSSKPLGEPIFNMDKTPKLGSDGKQILSRYDSTTGISKKDLFNLDKIHKQDTVLIVEGYPDAAYLIKAGLDNIVALGQGILSQTHIAGLVAKKVKNVILALDNDGVGPVNTEEAIKLLLEKSDIVPFILNPEKLKPHKDPDEYIRANGIKEFKNLLKECEKGLRWLCTRYADADVIKDPIQREEAKNKLLELSLIVKDPEDLADIKNIFIKNFNIAKSDVNDLIKSVKEEKNLKDFKKITSSSDSADQRYFPFIEKNTSSYAYFDKTADSVHLGVTKDILSNILLSAQQRTPEIFPALKADFDVTFNERYDLEKEMFNFFTPTEYMKLNKTEEFLNPVKEFPHIYRLLINLIPKYKERKRFLNWLAGILQTRMKQQTAWVFKSDQGAGKNLMLSYILKPLFGSKQVAMVNDSQLASEFNPWLQNAILIAFNEIAHDNNTRNSVKSTIKTIITEDEVTINEKNVKNFTITNYVNCIFFSNEKIPVFVEDKDRRLNIVTAAGVLRNYEWFNKNPEAFIEDLKKELPKFAQFLMNYKYDAQLAKTVIDNDDKKALVSVGMNRYEEFAYHLKKVDVDWFNENIRKDIFGTPKSLEEKDVKESRILKSRALELYKNIYDQNYASLVDLGKKLKLYGIVSYRDKRDDSHYYQW